MRNRGILHDGSNRIVRPWRSKAWVTCILDSKLPPRRPFTQGTYSELFFLDEVTAFSAGHRPCRYCQRERYDDFKRLWVAVNTPDRLTASVRIQDVDAAIHAERVNADRGKRRFEANASELPSGAFIEHEGSAMLFWEGKLLRWSFDGYTAAEIPPSAARVQVLTPPSVVRTFRAGFRPVVHANVGGL